MRKLTRRLERRHQASIRGATISQRKRGDSRLSRAAPTHRAQGSGEQAVARSPKRGRVRRLYSLARAIVRGLFTHHAFDHAASMAFYFFLGAIPLLAFVGLMVGTLVQREGAEELARWLYRVMPEAAATLLRTQLAEVAAANTGAVGIVSLAGFLWLSTNGIHNLMDIFELVGGATPRSWLRQRLISVVGLFAGLAVLATATWVLLLINGAATAGRVARLPGLIQGIGGFLAEGWQVAGVLGFFATLMTLTLAAFYHLATLHPPGVAHRVWPGTLVALVLWALVSWGFGAYVTTIGHYAAFYGGLATVAVILLWLYLTSLALLVGAEVNGSFQRGPPSPAGDPPAA